MALWAAHWWRERFSDPIRARQFARDTADLLKQLRVTAADLVFVPGAGEIELAGLLRTFRRVPEAAQAQWHLVFRREPPQHTSGGSRRRLARAFEHLGGCARSRPSPAGRGVGGEGCSPSETGKQREEVASPHLNPLPEGEGTLRSALLGQSALSGQHLNAGAAAGNVRFYADTEELSRQYEELAGLPFRTLPIPHTHAAPRPPRAPAGPLHILYLGDARKEKGFHHLPAIVRDLWTDCVATGRVAWTIQSNPALTDDEPEIRAAREQLRGLASDAVIVLTEALNSDQYGRLLLSGDIILLPYDQAAYRWRSSGILVEALAAGIPPIVPADTWLARQVPADVGVTYADIRQVPGLIRELIGHYDRYRASALRFSEDWIKRHNAASLIEMLSFV
jgi:glycosyltransferase involved in cell wall biosynthesis